MRLWVENWKGLGPELERIKWEELRAKTERTAYDDAETLAASGSTPPLANPNDVSPDLVEQQRLFAKARAKDDWRH